MPLLIAVVALAWILFQVPAPEATLHDPDLGMQISGGRQIAHGELPYVHWHANYGPLVFLSSFLVGALSGGRLLGDFLLSLIAYAAGYVLLYQGTLWLTGKRWPAVAVVTIALIGFPRFYKYYIVLCPMLTLATLYLYVEKRTLSRLVAMAVAVVIAGLYRPDFGYYSSLAATLSVFLGGQPGVRWKHFALLVASALVSMSPWWGYLLLKGRLLTYIQESTTGAAAMARGLRLPVPLYRFSESIASPHNLVAISYLFWWGLLLVALVLLVQGWRVREPIRRTMAATTLLLASLCMVQAMHRADYPHLLQAVPTSYIILGFVLAEGVRRLRRVPSQRLLGGLALLIVTFGTLTWIAASARSGPIAGINPAGPRDLAHFYTQRPRQFIERFRQEHPNHPELAVIDAVNRHVPPGRRLLAIPYLTPIYYLTDRPFAAGQMFLAPGFSSTEADQQETIRRLIAEGYPPVIEADAGFDNKPERAPKHFSAQLIQFIHTQYVPIQDPLLPPGYFLWRHPSAAPGTSASAPAPR